jgi:hypothetical protein
MIRYFRPSRTMAWAFHDLARDAELEGLLYERSYGRSSPAFAEIKISGLECVVVGEVEPHKDPHLRWNALWVLRSCCHTLLADRGGIPDTALLYAGALVALNVREWTHWTAGGRGALVLASFFSVREDTDETEIHAMIDGKLAARGRS